MTEDSTARTPDELAEDLEATAAVLRAEGAGLGADTASRMAANLRQVAGAVLKIPRVTEAATQLDAAAGLIRAHGLAMPPELAGEVAANIRTVADVVQGLGDAA